jgi:hypothetical protein
MTTSPSHEDFLSAHELSPTPVSKISKLGSSKPVQPIVRYSSSTRADGIRKRRAFRDLRKAWGALQRRKQQDIVTGTNLDTDAKHIKGPRLAIDMANKSMHNLPHSSTSEIDSLPRITQSTLVELLQGDYDLMYDEKILIDCRFEYEYYGGHIKGSLNFWDKEKLSEQLFCKPSLSKKSIVVLHCEFSEFRAPLM